MLDTTLCNSYLSVNLQTIINNMQSIQEDIGPDVECIPVLKDNAYCLGAVPIAKALCTYANVRTIAVAQVCEGVELRQAGLSAPAVLVLGGVPERLFPAAVEYGLQLTVFHPSTVYALEKLAAAQGKRAEVQIKVETGLNRTGAKPGAELGALAAALAVSTLSAGFGTASGRRHRSATEAHVQQRRQRLVPRLVLQRSTHRAPAVYG